jgi:DNA-binding transcriptional regulator LsrR (DeoR family)
MAIEKTNERSAGPATLVLTATVARRYYLEGASKSDIAAELGLSRFKVARLLEQARATGLVRIELDARGEIDLDLSVRLRTAHGLRHCVVIDAPEDDDALLRSALGRAAAELLAEIVEPGDVLGLAWARSLMAMRTSLTRLPACDVVQLTGALSLPSDDSSVELVRDLARRSKGQGFFYYAPMVLPDAGTARVLRTQPDIARAIERFPDVTKAVIGVGAWQRGLSTVVDALTEPERREMYELGVRSELSGVQIDADGNPVTTPLTDRLIGIDAPQLHAVPDVIAVAYGTAKVDAVHAGIRGGFITSLVTHTAMASGLLQRA